MVPALVDVQNTEMPALAEALWFHINVVAGERWGLAGTTDTVIIRSNYPHWVKSAVLVMEWPPIIE